ncbi:hypothetical protein [Mesorhizobium sp. B2-4-17]|nr:hypothetical protein [Mesorhizobium sp. B2-4-17]
MTKLALSVAAMLLASSSAFAGGAHGAQSAAEGRGLRHFHP